MRPSFKCNGMTLDANLDLLVCEHVTSALWRERPDGSREVLAYHYEGQVPEQPERRLRQAPTARSGSATRGTGVFRASASSASASSAGRASSGSRPAAARTSLELVVDKNEFDMPNGLCFSPMSPCSTSTTRRARTSRSGTSRADGSRSNGRMFFDGVGSGVIEDGIPDGMKCDERGNIWVTGPGGVWVISPEGEHLGDGHGAGEHRQPELGGPDWHTLFIPSSTSLYSIRTTVGPRRESYMR